MDAISPADVRDLDAHVERMHAAGQSRKTIDARVGVVTRLARDLHKRLRRVRTPTLVTWLARPGWSRNTRSIYRYHIQAYYAWMHETRRIRRNPAAELPLVKVPRQLPKPVPAAIVTDVLARARDPYRRYILIALFGGLRCAEIATLHTSDVTEDYITVRGKGDKVRLVDTHPLVWDSISSLPPGPVWHLWHPDPVTRAHRLSNRCATYVARLGYRGMSMHRWRHTFATNLLLPVELGGAGADILVVKELLGHESVATTEGYTLVSGIERRRAVRALLAT